MSYRNAARASNPAELQRRIAEKQLEETKLQSKYLAELAKSNSGNAVFAGL